MGVGLRSWPGELHAFAHRQLQAAAQRRLNARLIDFAVALRGMAVTNLEQCAADVNGNKQGRAGDQLLVVEIAGVGAWRIAADAADFRRRRNTHAAEEGPQRYDDVWKERRGHRLAIEANDRLAAAGLTVLADESAAAVVAVGDRQIDGQHLHFQRVARFSAGHVDRAGQDVTAGPAIFHLLDDRAE